MQSRKSCATLGVLLAVLCNATTAFPQAERASRRIRVAIGDAPYKQAYESVATEYERQHPDVDVQIMVIPADGYATWIRTAVAGGRETAPDIFNPNQAQGFYESGKSISLSPYLQSVSPYTGKKWGDGFIPEHLAMMKVAGDYPSIPYNFIEIGLFYNKNLFRKAGVEPPNTWEELDTVCTKLRASGVVPIVVPSDFESVWAGACGWLVRIVTDSAFYLKIDEVRARPGDFNYSPENDGSFKTDVSNPHSDLLVSTNMERYLQAILDGRLAYDGEEMRAVYVLLKNFSKHWQKGYLATNFDAAYQLFLTQRCAIMMHHSGAILGFTYDIEKLKPENRFEWGVFQFPTATANPAFRIPFRGVGSPIPIYGVIRSNKAQQDLAADFLMFLTAPQTARGVMDKMLAEKQSIIGPFAIRDVPLPPELAERFQPFLSRGREKMQLRGLYDEQQATWRWVLLVQDYLGGATTLDQLLEQYQRTTVEAIPRLIRTYDLDMDPTTRDNNKVLETELKQTVTGMPAGQAESPEDVAAYLASALKELARPVQTHSEGPVQFVIDRTIPVAVTMSRGEADRLAGEGPALTRHEGWQYLAIVLVEDGKATLKVQNFRQTAEEVIGQMTGTRYGRVELDSMVTRF